MADLVERLRSWKQVRTTPYPIGYYLDAGIKAADEIERLQSLLEAANAYGAGENKARVEDRELLAQMMIRQSLATGHGDTVADLVRELEPQIERLRAELACYKAAEAAAIENMDNALLMREDAIAERNRLRAEVAELKEANERFGLRQEWWNERMFTLEQERDRLRELLREAREELTLWMYHGHGSKTSGFGSATLCNKIDAALWKEKS